MAKEKVYIAIHTVGKPRKPGVMPGTWNPGDHIKESELGEHVDSLLRRGAIRSEDGAVLESDQPDQSLQIKAQARTIEDLKRQLGEFEEANKALTLEVERLTKLVAPVKPKEG